MIGVDTNLLVRLITNANPIHARLVTRQIDSDESFLSH